VVSYDRAGLGWSDPSPAPRDAVTMAVELHAALHAAGVPGPFVLAGHSCGGQPLGAETLDARQEELPGLSTNIARRVIATATHESLIADREHAGRVANAILAVVDATDGRRVETTWAAREPRPPGS